MPGQNTGRPGKFNTIGEILKAQKEAEARKKAQNKKNAAGLKRSMKKNKKKGK